jgi:hypothetical protein
MKRVFGAAVVFLSGACGIGVDPGAEFRGGVPSASQVRMDVPASAQKALAAAGTRRDGLETVTAEYYETTRAVTTTVNGATVAVLTLIEKIVNHPATSVKDNVAVWGPHTEALSPNTWRLTVTRRAPNDHSYVLEAKAKSEADSAFRVILSGDHTETGPTLGSGQFLLDFDAAQALPEHDENVGKAQVTYAKLSEGASAQVDADFKRVREDDSKQLVDAKYHYKQESTGGSFEFELRKDFVKGASIEVGAIRSRWLNSGAGRADVRASGGDLSSPATLSECWDTSFARRFLEVSFDPSKNEGSVSLCVFPEAEFAKL